MWHTGVKLLFRGSCTWHWHTMDAKAVSSSSTTASETAGSNGKAAKLAKAPVSRTVHPIDSSNIQPSSVAPNLASSSVVSQSPALHGQALPQQNLGRSCCCRDQLMQASQCFTSSFGGTSKYAGACSHGFGCLLEATMVLAHRPNVQS